MKGIGGLTGSWRCPINTVAELSDTSSVRSPTRCQHHRAAFEQAICRTVDANIPGIRGPSTQVTVEGP